MDTREIGQFLASLRRERNLTQQELGEKLGVTNKTVSRWETGEYLPPVEMLQMLSEYHGISINEILSARRLSASDYKTEAEKHIVSALSNSGFTLKEKIDFYKRKWRKDHWQGFVLGMLAVVALYVAGTVLDNGLQLAGYIFCAGFLIVQNNRMMAYVEARAFDGSGKQ